MPYGYGRGFGFRGSSPPWPYVGRGRGGLPRCWYFLGPRGAPASPGYWQPPYPSYGGAWEMPYGAAGAPGAMPYAPQMSREQELDFLRGEANAAKQQLEQIQARISEMEAEGG